MVTTPEPAPEPSAHPKREQIIEAARTVIEEHGPDALTGQIAQRAGLARPNVYRHFASKDDLDNSLARSVYQELRGEIQKRLDLSGTPLEVIRAPIMAQAIWADRHPNLYRFLVSRGYQRTSQRPGADGGELAADLVTAGARYFPHFADDPAAAARVFVGLGGLIDASILGWLGRRSETRKRLIDRLTTQSWLIIDQHLRDVGVQRDADRPLPQTKRNGRSQPTAARRKPRKSSRSPGR